GEASAEADAEPGADRRGDRVDAERPAAPLRRKPLADQRDGAGKQARLADAGEEPRPEERPEARGEAAGGGREAPHREAERDHVHAHGAVRGDPEREAGDRVDQREREAADDPELRVAEAEL